jgi:uncharacterized Fe-S cluster-containing radical SAM superfamily protein
MLLKGCGEEEFRILTGAESQGFGLQLEALRRLVEAEVNCSPAVMISFSTKNNLKAFERRINNISRSVRREIEIG